MRNAGENFTPFEFESGTTFVGFDIRWVNKMFQIVDFQNDTCKYVYPFFINILIIFASQGN